MARKRDRDKTTPPAARTGDAAQEAVPWWRRLLGNVALSALSPVVGLIAAAFLVFGGIVLACAWQVGAQPLVDYHAAKPLTARTQARIVDAWSALEFDPDRIRRDTQLWQPYAKIAQCAVVEYGQDWGAPVRRAFCGNRFAFRDDFTLADWITLAPGVPFSYLRDGNDLAVPQMRLDKGAYDWLAAHPPHSTFRFGEPKPRTALEALQRQLDAPLEVALSSWTHPLSAIALAYDPRQPENALPAALVDARRTTLWGPTLGFAFALVGVAVWRRGVRFFFLDGQAPALVWLLTLLPLLALPWWGEALPQIVRHVNADWADVAESMLDDLARVTRFVASAPDDATLADGRRLVWSTDHGLYADTFGRMRLQAPDPAPATNEAALAALNAQIADDVARLAPADQAALFRRLSRQHENFERDVQPAFKAAALRAVSDADDATFAAAKHFLVYAIGGYYEDQVDAMRAKATASR
jgi:hypothetical protein